MGPADYIGAMDTPLETLLAQEAELQFTKFDSATAWKIGSWLADKARKESLRVVVGITKGGQRLFHWAADGTCPDNDSWVDRKTRTVYRWGHSSFYMGRKVARENTSGAAKYFVDEREYAFDGGSFPVIVKGVGVVGTVTVSGLKQNQDHDLAVQAIRHHLRK
jgi:uncharacterized protein (UPF0303 family)